MQTKFSLILQSARTELISAVNQIVSKYGLPASLLEGVMSSVLVEVKSQVISEIVAETANTEQEEHADE